MDGLDLRSEITAPPELPVMIVTAYGDDERRQPRHRIRHH
jgi:hypothetical protein